MQYRFLEFVFLFFGLPLLVIFRLVPNYPIPALVAGAGVIAYHLHRDPSFDSRQFGAMGIVSKQLPRIVIRFLLLATVLGLAVYFFLPDRFLRFVLERPHVWIIVMCLYPIVSVYPQEIIYRAFIFHRYREIFPTDSWMIGASALSFGFVHLIFGHWISVVLSALGGILFALTYRNHRSVVLSSIEHALYGDFIFTIGLGLYFYHGAAGLQ